MSMTAIGRVASSTTLPVRRSSGSQPADVVKSAFASGSPKSLKTPLVGLFVS